MSTLDYLKFSINFIDGTGLAPRSSIQRKLISLLVFVPLCFVLNFLVFFMFRNAEGDILLISEAFESLSTLTQGWVRKFILIVYASLIQEIIQECENLWHYDMVGEEIATASQNKMQLCIKMVKALIVCCVGTITLLAVTAIMDTEKPVPLLCWTPESKFWTAVIFISEMLFLLEAIYLVVALDSFYLLVCVDLELQYNLMKEMLKSIRFDEDSEEKCFQKLILCTQHHRRLLRLHKKLNKVYSGYFIVQYTITITAVAIQGYLVLYSSPSIDAMVKSAVYFGTIMFQVAMFFIPASNIEIEAEEFSLEIYHTNWESNRSRKVGKHLLFMLMKSQQPLSMLGGGMLHINRNQYIVLLRVSFTIATLLGGLNKS